LVYDCAFYHYNNWHVERRRLWLHKEQPLCLRALVVNSFSAKPTNERGNRKAMAKPVLLSVDDDPNVLSAIARDLRR
jgi:hypothetical protein